jgi:hypothetical protein
VSFDPVLGTCSLCGGPVTVPRIWGGVTPPVKLSSHPDQKWLAGRSGSTSPASRCASFGAGGSRERY